MPLTLIHAPRSRSTSIMWLLEELGEPYDVTTVDIRRGDGSGRLDPANPHPHGKVPVLLHDETVVYERTAIALYLTDAFPRPHLGPVVGDKARGAYLTWLAYYSGVIEPAFLSAFMKTPVPRGTAAWVAVDEVMAHVNARLGESQYLVHDAFTAADIFYAGAFHLFWETGNFEKTKALEGYVQRCVSRPACARASAKDSG